MRQCIGKGRNPIALIDGLIQFAENHLDNFGLDDADRKLADKALAELRKGNLKLDRLFGSARIWDGVAYYNVNKK